MKIYKQLLYLLSIISLIALVAFIFIEFQKKDTVAPVISIPKEELTLSINSPESDYLSDVTAKDNFDGNVTKDVFVENIDKGDNTEIGVFDVFYVAIDNKLNVGKATRKLNLTDYYSPRFSIEQPLTIAPDQGATIRSLITATDCIDGDISSFIKITGDELEKATLEVGVYHSNIEVTNSLGDTAVLPITVEVTNQNDLSKPQILFSNYVVYVPLGEGVDLLSYPQYIYDDGTKEIDRAAVETTDDDNYLYYSYTEEKTTQSTTIPISSITYETELNTQVPGVYPVTYHYTSTTTNTSCSATIYVCVEGR
jgi:hypothetical protein